MVARIREDPSGPCTAPGESGNPFQAPLSSSVYQTAEEEANEFFCFGLFGHPAAAGDFVLPASGMDECDCRWLSWPWLWDFGPTFFGACGIASV